MNDEKVFVGQPLLFKEICFIYPPLNKDIIKIGYNKFLTYLSIITKSQEDIEDELKDSIDQITAEGGRIPTPFEYILTLSSLSQDIKKIFEESFEFFLQEKVIFLKEIPAILVGPPTEKRLIKEEDFFDFQNVVRSSICTKLVERPNPNEHIKIRKMKAKQRERDRVKAKKSGTCELNTLLTSICCLGIGITPFNVGDLTYGAMNQLIARSQKKETYDTDVASLLAGADPKKVKIDYWIKDFDKN